MATKKTIKTQGDFDKQMNSLQQELRNIMNPITQRENELRVEIAELNVKKGDLCIAQQTQKEHWAQICELKDIREEKLACLADGRKLKMELAKLWAEINKRTLELRILQQKRKAEAQPFHDKMHELIMKYPKGSLPMIEV